MKNYASLVALVLVLLVGLYTFDYAYNYSQDAGFGKYITGAQVSSAETEKTTSLFTQETTSRGIGEIFTAKNGKRYRVWVTTPERYRSGRADKAINQVSFWIKPVASPSLYAEFVGNRISPGETSKKGQDGVQIKYNNINDYDRGGKEEVHFLLVTPTEETELTTPKLSECTETEHCQVDKVCRISSGICVGPTLKSKTNDCVKLSQSESECLLNGKKYSSINTCAAECPNSKIQIEGSPSLPIPADYPVTRKIYEGTDFSINIEYAEDLCDCKFAVQTFKDNRPREFSTRCGTVKIPAKNVCKTTRDRDICIVTATAKNKHDNTCIGAYGKVTARVRFDTSKTDKIPSSPSNTASGERVREIWKEVYSKSKNFGGNRYFYGTAIATFYIHGDEAPPSSVEEATKCRFESTRYGEYIDWECDGSAEQVKSGNRLREGLSEREYLAYQTSLILAYNEILQSTPTPVAAEQVPDSCDTFVDCPSGYACPYHTCVAIETTAPKPTEITQGNVIIDYCESASECPSGYICPANVCVAVKTTVPEPVKIVQPSKVVKKVTGCKNDLQCGEANIYECDLSTGICKEKPVAQRTAKLTNVGCIDVTNYPGRYQCPGDATIYTKAQCDLYCTPEAIAKNAIQFGIKLVNTIIDTGSNALFVVDKENLVDTKSATLKVEKDEEELCVNIGPGKYKCPAILDQTFSKAACEVLYCPAATAAGGTQTPEAIVEPAAIDGAATPPKLILPECSDGKDNDGNGKADFTGVFGTDSDDLNAIEITQKLIMQPDPGCSSPTDNDESDDSQIGITDGAEDATSITSLVEKSEEELCSFVSPGVYKCPAILDQTFSKAACEVLYCPAATAAAGTQTPDATDDLTTNGDGLETGMPGATDDGQMDNGITTTEGIDLVPTLEISDRASYTVGSPVEIKITILNNGDISTDSARFYVNLRINGRIETSYDLRPTSGLGVNGLGPGMSKVLIHRWTPKSVGTKIIKLEVDVTGAVSEGIDGENNNIDTEEISVVAAGAGPKPDLIIIGNPEITLATDPQSTTIRAGETVRARVRVQNAGLVDVPTTRDKIQIRVVIENRNNAKVCEQTWGADLTLARREVKEINLPLKIRRAGSAACSLSDGDYTAEFSVDHANIIDEADEDNNDGESFTFRVGRGVGQPCSKNIEKSFIIDERSYCDLNGDIQVRKAARGSCLNDFECVSNYCAGSSVCADRSLIQELFCKLASSNC